MALPSTIFKIEMDISDLDRHYYETHNLTLARHPSETDERLIARLIAFAFHASSRLHFGLSIGAGDEPDLFEKDYAGDIILWISVGCPDEKLIKKACSRSERVAIYSYGGSEVQVWWDKLKIDKFDKLSIFRIPQEISTFLAGKIERSFKVQCTIEDGILWWNSDQSTLEIKCEALKK